MPFSNQLPVQLEIGTIFVSKTSTFSAINEIFQSKPDHTNKGMYDDEIDVDDAENVSSDSDRSPDPTPHPGKMEVSAEMRPKVERPQSANVAVSFTNA